jgi:hypothetical protein
LASPAAGLPAGGGSLLSSNNVLIALAAVAFTGLAIGVLVTVPRISPLAAGLPGLLLIAWTVLYLVSVRQAVGLIPLRSNSFGMGWEGMLFNGVLGGAGLAMAVPLFLPSRWRQADATARVSAGPADGEAQDLLADLKDSPEPVRTGRSLPPDDSPSRPTAPVRPALPRTTGSFPDQ